MISVIILNHNGREHLQTCLSSLDLQSIGPDSFETIVVDNGSTDGSVEYISSAFPQVRTIRLEENTGFSKAANAGFHASLGDLVVFLNNDTETHPDWLKELSLAAERHKDFAFFASKMLFFDKRDVIDSAGDLFSGFGHGVKRGHGEKDRGQYDREEEIFGACGGAAMYTRHAFRDAGGFDEKFFAYCEDVDLNFRLRKAGLKCLFVPSAVVYHKLGGTAKVQSDTHVYYTQRNQEIVLLKHASAKIHFIHFLYNFYSLIRHLLLGKAGVFIRAKLDALKMMKEYAGEIEISAVTESAKDDVDETDTQVGKLASSSYGDFFITDENSEQIKGYLNSSNLSSEILSLAGQILAKKKAEGPYQLSRAAVAYWLTLDRQYLNFYVRELNRALDELSLSGSDLFHLAYGFYFVRQAELPYELKKKFVRKMRSVAADRDFDSPLAPVSNKAGLFMLSLAFPFILKYQYNDNFEKFTAAAPSEGIVDPAMPEKSFELFEAMTVFLILLKLRRKVEEKDFYFKARRLFEFLCAYARPDGGFPAQPTAFLMPGKKPDMEYLLFLKFLAGNDWDNISGGSFMQDFILLGGSFSAEEKELKPPKHRLEQKSSGFPVSRLYILKSDTAYTLTGYRSSELRSGNCLISGRNDRSVVLDDSIIVYDKHERTNLWAVGREFDILDLQYEITPSVTHRRQIYFNKKDAYWVFREKFYGAEQHNVKIRFFMPPEAAKELKAPSSKQVVRDCINKFTRANKLDASLLKLNAEDPQGYQLDCGYAIVPLNNPGLEKRSDAGWTGYTANMLFPNEIVYLIYRPQVTA